jgi:dienelactone hydrolase
MQKNHLFILLAAFPAFLTPALAQREHRMIELSGEIIKQIITRQFEQLEGRLDSNFKACVPAAKIQEVWDDLPMFYGKFERAGVPVLGNVSATHTLFHFAKTDLDLTIAFDSNEKVLGMHFHPYRVLYPGINDHTHESEKKEMKVGTFGLPGELTVPLHSAIPEKGFPLLVLVHGSSPWDMNDIISRNKPFRNLADMLAMKGVAVFRYDKRAHVLRERKAWNDEKLTVMEETIEDARVALRMARTFEGIDSSRIFLLGQGFGGMLAPRIAETEPYLLGIILMGAHAIPLEDIVERQARLNLADYIEQAQDDPYIRQVKKQAETVKSNSLKSNTPATKLPLALPASYWLDLKRYDCFASALKFPGSFLVLQAEKDQIVSLDDFALWRNKLPADRSKFITYPGLDHFFRKVEEAKNPGLFVWKNESIPALVIDDIAGWIINSGN